MTSLVLESALRATLVIASVAVVLKALRVESPAVRHALWTGVLILMLLLPALVAWGPNAPLPVLPTEAAGRATSVFSAGTPNQIVAAAPFALWAWQTIVPAAYLVGLITLLFRLALSMSEVRSLRREARPIGGRLTHERCASPIVVGYVRPMVILPRGWSAWTEEQLDAVLLHEGEHIRRRDPLIQWVALLNRAVFWFHPLAWWLERHVSALAEDACDDAVLARGHDVQEYREQLIALARAASQAGARIQATAVAMAGARLPRRIHRILQGINAPEISRMRLACAVAAFVAIGVVCGSGTLTHAEGRLGVQVMPDNEDQYFEGIDLLDATKIVPEELAPVQPIGRMTLNRNPANFFAEVEQVAYHAGHLVRGIEVVDDPLMQARLFSYLDTQLTRLGGPNFAQIPINRPARPVNDNLRDGFMQQAVHHGRTPYLPNAVGGGCPFLAGAEDGGYVHVPRMVAGPKIRERGPDDEYAQATLFWNSMSEVEQDHIVDAYTFELGKVEVQARRRADGPSAGAGRRGARPPRVLSGSACLPPAQPPRADNDEPARTRRRPAALTRRRRWRWSPRTRYPADGRVVHILANDGADLAGIRALRDACTTPASRRMCRHPQGRDHRPADGGDELTVDRSFHTASSAEADAVVVAGGAGLAATRP